MDHIGSLLADKEAVERLALGGVGVIMVMIALLFGLRMILQKHRWSVAAQLQGRHYRRRS